jgi:hypothetical protein
MGIDSPMVMHILTDGPTVGRLTSAGAVRTRKTGTGGSGEAVIDPAETYIAACRAARCRDPWSDDGTAPGPDRCDAILRPLWVTPIS